MSVENVLEDNTGWRETIPQSFAIAHEVHGARHRQDVSKIRKLLAENLIAGVGVYLKDATLKVRTLSPTPSSQ